jgi:Leucine-rich repeat (LRR) protein
VIKKKTQKKLKKSSQRSSSPKNSSKQGLVPSTGFQVSFRFAQLTLSFHSDGSSYTFGTLTCEEQDPPLQNLTDVNEKSENFKECDMLAHPNLRSLKLSNNAITDINEVVSLKHLLELEAKNNQIGTADFLANPVLQYL